MAPRRVAATVLPQLVQYTDTPSVSDEPSVKKRRQTESAQSAEDKRRRLALPSSPQKSPRSQKDISRQSQQKLSPPQRPSRHAKGRPPQMPASPTSPASQPSAVGRWKPQDGLNKKAASLGRDRIRTIYRWMWQHNTRTAKGHEFEFKLLLATLGFSDPVLSPQLRNQLRTKVRDQIRHTSEDLKRLKAITMVLDGNKKKVVQFAEWTEGWMSGNWDGDPRPPSWTQVFLNPYFGEGRGWLHMKVPVSSKEDSDSLLAPETLVVEEREATELANHSNNSGQSRGPDITSPGAFNFLCRSHLAVSSPSYEVDVSELPQYLGVQLTPTDPNHPLRPDPRFVPLDMDCCGEDMYEEEHHGDEYYEDYEARTEEYHAYYGTTGSEMFV